MSAIELRGVTRRFEGGTFALRDVSVVFPSGLLSTLLGPSGCGKTTLLRLAAGLDAVSAGSILIDGLDVGQHSASERNLSLLFQDFALFPHLDVAGNVGFGLRTAGVSAKSIGARVRDALSLVGMQELGHSQIRELSGGQQQRVALARALVLEPSILLLDEPLTGLDDHLRRRLRDEIRTLQRRLGITMVCVTHDEKDAMAFSDFMVIMRDGRVLQTGLPRDLYERPADEFVAGFMGDAAIFDVTRTPRGELMLGPLALVLEAPSSGSLRAMVRPEAWCILPASRDGLAGRIVRCSYLGRRVEYEIETHLGRLLVLSSQSLALHQPGAPVSLALGTRGVSVWSDEPKEVAEK